MVWFPVSFLLLKDLLHGSEITGRGVCILLFLMRFWSKYFLCYSPLWPLLLHWRILYSWLLSSIASLFLFFMLSFFGIFRSNARNLKALIQLESRSLSVEKSPCTWLLKVFDIFSSSKKKKAILVQRRFSCLLSFFILCSFVWFLFTLSLYLVLCHPCNKKRYFFSLRQQMPLLIEKSHRHFFHSSLSRQESSPRFERTHKKLF